MKIKICGIFREIDVDYVNEALPDYVGFVFAKSRRQVTIEQAKNLKQKLNPKIKAVGVFVDASIEKINELINQKIIDIVQLHGNESEAFISKINATVIKAVRIGDEIPQNADYILFDGINAGSGEVFDWSLLPSTKKPFFLAGGISLNNIDEAIKINPFCIDVSSSVETDGFKDKSKISEIVRRVKNV